MPFKQSYILLVIIIFLTALISPMQGFAATLPPGFTETSISGLSTPTAFAIHPDGRFFITQQGGALRIIKNGTLLPTPFTTVSTTPSGERGLLGIAIDPNYAVNRYIYVYYTALTPSVHNRVSRFTADPANEDVALAGSELVLLDLDNLSGATNHNGGAIHFGADGKLYVAVGDNASSGNATSLNNRLGKMLRINSDGTIPGDNPTTFPGITGSPTGLNQAIWAVGLRNPYTFGVQPGTGRMYINDVGQNTWEEIDDAGAGINFGWPTCEGAFSARLNHAMHKPEFYQPCLHILFVRRQRMYHHRRLFLQSDKRDLSRHICRQIFLCRLLRRLDKICRSRKSVGNRSGTDVCDRHRVWSRGYPRRKRWQPALSASLKRRYFPCPVHRHDTDKYRDADIYANADKHRHAEYHTDIHADIYADAS